MLQLLLAAALGLGGWYVTGWVAAGLVGAMAGWTGPLMVQAPKKRHAVTDEIEAYSQWAEQVRDLVGASGSLFEAVVLSAGNAPGRLRPRSSTWRPWPAPWGCRTRSTGSPPRCARRSPTAWCWA